MTNLIITDKPAQEAGEHISAIIREHTGDVMCLIAGGSTLAVVEYIDPHKHCFHEECKAASTLGAKTIQCQKSECRTIFMMGDERGSREPSENNYLQLVSKYPEHPVTERTLRTDLHEGENLKNFATRIEKTFLEKLTELNNPKIIFLLGIGADGHTAGIFPLSEAEFRRTYRDDLTYAPVHLEGLRIDSRASFTPSWILNNADELIGFAVGADKQEILAKLSSETKKINERPAELLNQHKRSTFYTDQDIEPDSTIQE